MAKNTPLFADIFARQVALTPHTVAVEFRTRTLTYRELDDAAARLATALRERGAGPGTLVGISGSPSHYLPVAVLGVLRAGAAWLPLDPGYPAERLQYMIADSGIRLLVADPVSAAVLGHGLDVVGPDVSTAPSAAVPVGPHDAAYVIYTSGSTGRPKGVTLTHGGLANLVAAQQAAFDVGPGDRVLQFAPSSFDASVFETVMALATGATLVLASRDALAPGPGLTDLLRRDGITHLTVPPSVLATLPAEELPALRTVICAGEALPEHLVRRWQPGRRMVNAYGPTETTVWATAADVKADDGKPSIGTAILGADVVVADDRLRPVPTGVPGELLIGGAGVARGYLGRPGLTAQRFVPDPATPGGRRYRTGDLVVRHPDGNLEFLGRVDNQVKIRGVRIEPEEIARCLAEHDAVHDAVVVPLDLGRGDELYGYVTGTADPQQLLAHLRSRLPEHTVPADVVVLDTMPLTPSGKIDRSALPEPPRGRSHQDYVAPRTPTEQALAEMIAELLHLERVGIHEEFFALGGHSLLAGRLAARVRQELGRELPLRLLYQSPTVAGMAAVLDGGEGHGLTPPPIETTTGDDPAPLSFPQERVWFLEKLVPGNLAYNAQATLRLRGPLDPDALRATLTEIVRRHEVFRCAYVAEAGTPTQRPMPPMPVELPIVDLTGLPAGARDDRVEEIVADTVRTPFDLARPPLARWVLIRQAEDDHTLVHVEHHLVHDGWSFALFVRELQRIYPAALDGEVHDALPEPRYTDFARWQRNWLRGDVLDKFLAYWTSELDGCPTALELPLDRPRPRVQSFRGAVLRVDVPPALSGRLRHYSRARGVTLYSVMLSGFAALLSRHAGQDEVVVGSGVANRRLAETEDLIGMIVNTLALRIDLRGAPGFDELVGRAHATVGRASQWQDMPLELLVDALDLPRDPGRNPLFQAMFSFHDSQVPELDFAGVRGTVLERHNGSAKTDINVVVVPRAEQRAGHAVLDDADPITLIWEYATDLFDAETTAGLVERYLALLDAAVADPATSFDRLPMPVGEQPSSGPVTDYSAGRTIPELFAEQVAARPDALAIVDGDREYTYAELDRRANSIAHALRANGVGPDSPVGVLLPRGGEMIVAVLAVLKAGGAYVPLDPGYPAERLELMAGEADLAAVVTRSPFGGLLTGLPVLTMEDVTSAAADAPPLTAGPRNLAYILFTSGSTGRPKGVMVEHRSVLRLVCGTDYAEFRPGERFAQVADASFDALTFELWGALLHGGTVCVIDTETLLTPGGLGRALEHHGVTAMFLTSALFTEVMADHPGSFAGLRTLLVGGDALHADRVRRLLGAPAAQRPERLMNGYGPTEATTFAVCHLIEEVPAEATSVPIGRPIANTTAHVLDAHLAPVPAGVAGELYIGGPGVARGYAGRPGLTAQRFVPDPHAGDGGRLYRTGDLVRLRRDGLIEFLGRADGQVKIRGFRVEPGEVEAVLAAHPGVAQVAVVVQDAPGGRRLAAYVVGAATTAEMRDFLADRLPPYLMPSRFVRLPAMPMTASGKVDRAALPQGDDPDEAAGYEPPRTATELAVAELIAESLGLTRVGRADDFFRLGGHSLLAMRLVARINERFGTDVPLRRFLLTPTVTALAAEVDAAAGAATPDLLDTDAAFLDRLEHMSDADVEELLQTMAENEADR
ncbi:amino acid adenylation domain-containing protein [Actinoplanes sp. NPDC049681]|uniref:amino acid adenylation domain-containing protein n=1 Tax=Actinoplanes sp. NPDC049681 TaxID=3363905 RepID=UPI0037A5649B